MKSPFYETVALYLSIYKIMSISRTSIELLEDLCHLAADHFGNITLRKEIAAKTISFRLQVLSVSRELLLMGLHDC